MGSEKLIFSSSEETQKEVWITEFRLHKIYENCLQAIKLLKSAC